MDKSKYSDAPFLNGSFTVIPTDELTRILNFVDKIGPILEMLNAPATKTTSEEMLTAKETAEFLRINPTTLWKWRKDGKITPVAIGGRVLYRKSDVQSLVA